MSALSDYISELKRQADLLEAAAHRDDQALTYLNRPVEAGKRRVWTRQDRNRLEAECAFDDASIDDPVFKTRQDTRVHAVCRKLPDIRPFHRAALAEAQRLNTYIVVAETIAEATNAHERLIRCYRDDEGSWPRIQRRHAKAVSRLEALAIPDADEERQTAERLTEQSTSDGDSQRIGESSGNLELDEKAVAVFLKHKDWKKKEIAAFLNCHPKSLAPKRCPHLHGAMQAYRKPDLPRGSKDSQGNLEAWDDG